MLGQLDLDKEELGQLEPAKVEPGLLEPGQLEPGLARTRPDQLLSTKHDPRHASDQPDGTWTKLHSNICLFGTGFSFYSLRYSYRPTD